MKGYTKIPNQIFTASQLSINARFLYCILLKYCGKDDYCYPSQKTLAIDIVLSERHVRNILKELIIAGLIVSIRRGWNRSNTYKVSKFLKTERYGGSCLIGSQIPLHQGKRLPPKSTYIKAKGKTSIKGLNQVKDVLLKKGLLK